VCGGWLLKSGMESGPHSARQFVREWRIFFFVASVLGLCPQALALGCVAQFCLREQDAYGPASNDAGCVDGIRQEVGLGAVNMRFAALFLHAFRPVRSGSRRRFSSSTSARVRFVSRRAASPPRIVAGVALIPGSTRPIVAEAPRGGFVERVDVPLGAGQVEVDDDVAAASTAVRAEDADPRCVARVEPAVPALGDAFAATVGVVSQVLAAMIRDDAVLELVGQREDVV